MKFWTAIDDSWSTVLHVSNVKDCHFVEAVDFCIYELSTALLFGIIDTTALLCWVMPFGVQVLNYAWCNMVYIGRLCLLSLIGFSGHKSFVLAHYCDWSNAYSYSVGLTLVVFWPTWTWTLIFCTARWILNSCKGRFGIVERSFSSIV